jgi:hypothetical protein
VFDVLQDYLVPQFHQGGSSGVPATILMSVPSNKYEHDRNEKTTLLLICKKKK